MRFILNIIKNFTFIMTKWALGLLFVAGIATCGMFYLKNAVNSQLNPPKSELMQRAETIGNFSKIPKGYSITKALNLVGLTAVVAEHNKTGQYMAIVDTGWAMNISKNDIQTGSLSKKLQDYALKAASPNIKLENIEIIPKGDFNAFNQSVPYAQIKIKIAGSNTEKIYSGMIGIASGKQTNKNKLIVSLNRKGNFNQQVAENFFKKVSLQ